MRNASVQFMCKRKVLRVQLFSLLAALHKSHEMQLDKKYAIKPKRANK
jgi:hypothetical protein